MAAPPNGGRNPLRSSLFRGTGVYHVTTVTDGRRPLLRTDQARAIFARCLADCETQGLFSCLAYVLMPDHLHMVIWLPHGHAVADGVRRLKGRFARELNVALGREGRVWQPSYWERTVRDEQALREMADYTHANPVRAGIVERPEDYPASSCGEFAERYVRTFGQPPPPSACSSATRRQCARG